MSKLPPIVEFRICTGFSMAVYQMRGELGMFKGSFLPILQKKHMMSAEEIRCVFDDI